jgi:hypothetical protein
MPSIRTLCLVTLSAVVLLVGSTTFAQNAEPKVTETDQQVEGLLGKADLFYKKSYNEQAQRWEYKVAWSEKGETTLINIYLRSMGTRGDGSPIHIVYGWTQVFSAGQDQQLAPEVIKAVAAANDGLSSGNVSTAGNGVYANVGIVLQDLTPSVLSLYLWDLHHTRVGMRREIDRVLGN